MTTMIPTKPTSTKLIPAGTQRRVGLTPKRRRIRFTPSGTVVTILILIVLGLVVFPFYWMVVTATTPDSNLYGAGGPQVVPNVNELGIFATVLGDSGVLVWLKNSAIIATGTTFLTLLLAIPIAYGFSRFRFRGKALVGIGLFVTQMLPEAMLVVPLFSIFAQLDLLNTFAGLILANTAFTLPIVTWVLKNAIDTVPIDIEEAARVDGASRMGILFRIIVPVTAPTMAATAVIAFFHGWNEYIFALTFITDSALRPASVGLAGYVGEITTPIQTVMAVGTLYTLPAVALYLILQKYIVSGMAAGSVKG
jgi:multiple sugar transport system permease protein